MTPTARKARGPLRMVRAAVQLPRHEKTVQGGQGRWKLTLSCGHEKEVKNCELPQGNQARCDICPPEPYVRKPKHVPFNLEERLKATK